MENEILIALLTKLVDEKISQSPDFSAYRGPRGATGPSGKDFVFSEHEETIRLWAKEFALKFEDLSEEQISQLRGQKGRDGDNGKDGRDGQDFSWDKNRERISSIIRTTVEEMSEGLKLKFSDLSDSDIDKLRGPRGFDGKSGRDFNLEEHKEYFETLRPKFTDFTEDEIGQLRGPRGRDGHDGRDFNFEEHREFFNSLKLKFSDLSEEEKEGLKLHFSELTEDEKELLKLKFKDLTQEDISLIRGPRGVRGQKGTPGRDGDTGPMGVRGLIGPRGIPGLQGIQGLRGINGVDGSDGKDAPYIVDIEIDVKIRTEEFSLVFYFSDGTEIRTKDVKMPGHNNYYVMSGGVSSQGGTGGTGDSFWSEATASVLASTSGVIKSLPLATFTGGTFHIKLATSANAYRRSLKMDIVKNDGAVEDQVYAIMGHLFNVGLSAIINGSNVELVLTNNESYNIDARILLEAN